LTRLFRPSHGALLALAAAACLAGGCGPTTPTGAPTPSPTATPVATPTPLPNPVATILVVGAVGESEAGSRSALAWQGAQEAAGILGGAARHVFPITAAELFAAVPAAAAADSPDGATVVVAVGPAGAEAALAVAGEHPSVLFLILDETLPDGAPANVHGLVFDDAEAGYLAGVVAAGVSDTGTVGFVAGVKNDPAAAGYLAGLEDGARQGSSAATVDVVYAGSSQDPQKGRAAVDGLADSGAGSVVAMPDLTGYGAMRQACTHELPVVALATEAALLLPDVRPCLVVSILRRYDVAVRDAIVGYAEGRPVPRVTVGTVANGGIAPGPFANPVAPGLEAALEDVLAAMRAGPPRPTPTPAESPGAPVPST
jgi:basic membrane lipoprotein Med (substrate-binding protein (PBP1-ABC) superfamily)